MKKTRMVLALVRLKICELLVFVVFSGKKRQHAYTPLEVVGFLILPFTGHMKLAKILSNFKLLYLCGRNFSVDVWCLAIQMTYLATCLPVHVS